MHPLLVKYQVYTTSDSTTVPMIKGPSSELLDYGGVLNAILRC